MSPKDMQEKISALAQQTAALADVIAIICTELTQRDQPAACKIANSLEAIADNPNIEPTAAFA